ncbi:uncharacterized protein LOC135924243 [Gordionus sp. m RMFG-2023]|uniref:uncharacterized protein LOC135924243 n=2 Tax=Gordionus sp. m RMFG-2023 TaxID=3053472 RepID=UPI0031FDA4A7
MYRTSIVHTSNSNSELDKMIHLGAIFSSYDSLSSIIKEYEQSCLVNLYIARSTLLKAPHPEELINLFKYQKVYYSCKYGGSIQKNRSKNIRNTSTFRKMCSFKFTVCLKYKDTTHFLQIVTMVNKHTNHDLDKNTFESLPKQRVLSLEERESVEKYLNLKANKLKIQESMLKLGKNITLKDIHNLQTNINKSKCNDLASIFQLLKGNKGSIVEVTEENDILLGIFFQDEMMQHNLKRYPEVMFVDATYKLNNYGMPLFITLIIDGNGESQIVSLWLVQSESYKCVKKMCDIMKYHNNNLTKLEVIVADKDMADRSAFYESFPAVNIHICIFHALRIFKREITAEKRKITTSEVKTVLEILGKMVYSKTEDVYNYLYEKLIDLKLPLVSLYFNTHWHFIRKEWVIYWRNESPHLLNFTNNRLESLNQKIKRVVNKYSPLNDLFSDLSTVVSSQAFERHHRNIMCIERLPCVTYACYTPENLYSILLTPYAFKIILNEISFHNQIHLLNIDTILNHALVCEKGVEFKITLKSCACGFLTCIKLPCRHILALHAALKLDIYLNHLCGERWTKKYTQDSSILSPEDSSLSQSYLNISQHHDFPCTKNLSTNEKFKQVQRILMPFSSLTSQLPQEIFDVFIEKLKKLDSIVQAGKYFDIIEVNQSIFPNPIVIPKINIIQG